MAYVKRQYWTLLAVQIVIHQAAAITNKNKSEEEQDRVEVRRAYNINTDQSKPFRFQRESSRIRYEDSGDRNIGRQGDRLTGEKDSQTSGSGQYDNGYGLYGPPEETGNNYQGLNYGTTYVSTIPFGSAHGDRGADFGQSYQRPYALDHHAPVAPSYHAPITPQYGQNPHALALKGLFLPLAGVALLGAAAALASNPILLQLGVITGRRRRRSLNQNDLTKSTISPYANPHVKFIKHETYEHKNPYSNKYQRGH